MNSLLEERRLLVLAPIGKDSALIEAMLRKHEMVCAACIDLTHLAREMAVGVGAVVVAEEAFTEYNGRLAAILAKQPPWSDLPVLLLTRPGADSAVVKRAVESMGNVTLLERPIRIAALASAARSALRARERQYMTRAHLKEREQADQRKDQFLATLAHELRNPLAPIRNSLAILDRSAKNAAAAPVYKMMERQVNHMVRLVDELMELSRITRGKIELRKHPIDLADVIEAALETSRPLIDAAGHELIVTMYASPLILDADSMRLAQVFSNLLNNAAKYTDPGGRISLVVQCEDGDAIVTITDTGIGIPAHALASVFEMFAQADARDRRAQSGLGIGLTLARSLVEMHGGKISAASEGQGCGSCFVVRLPLSERQEAIFRTQSSRTQGIPARQRVLVVDDNEDGADSLGMLLQMLGAEVRVVYSGRAALELIDEFHPRVVVLDLGMPGMDGYEVARRIRERADARSSTLIALTGWGQQMDRNLTEAAGFDHHLIKPVDIEAMQAVLASVAA